MLDVKIQHVLLVRSLFIINKNTYTHSCRRTLSILYAYMLFFHSHLQFDWHSSMEVYSTRSMYICSVRLLATLILIICTWSCAGNLYSYKQNVDSMIIIFIIKNVANSIQMYTTCRQYVDKMLTMYRYF